MAPPQKNVFLERSLGTRLDCYLVLCVDNNTQKYIEQLKVVYYHCQCKVNVGEKVSLVPRMLKVHPHWGWFGPETMSQKLERSLRII